jgi:hypothetical protein
MSPVLDAIAVINSAPSNAPLSYRAASRKFGVDCTTLLRRHQNKQDSYAGMSQQQRILNPHNEAHLVLYIQQLFDRGLPPTRTMIKTFASKVAKWPPSGAWILSLAVRG